MVSVLGICGSCGVRKHLRYSIHSAGGCDTGGKMCSACYERERLKRNKAKAEALKRARSSKEDRPVHRHQHAQRPQRIRIKKRMRVVDEIERKVGVSRVLNDEETGAAEALKLMRTSASLTVTLEDDGSDDDGSDEQQQEEEEEVQTSRDDPCDGTGRVRNHHTYHHIIHQRRQEPPSPVPAHMAGMSDEHKTRALASGEKLISEVMELTRVARTLADQVQAQQNELNACVQLQRTLATDLRSQLRVHSTLGFSLMRQLISVNMHNNASRVPC